VTFPSSVVAERERGAFESIARWILERPWFLALSVVALTYAVLAGLRTVADYDVFWQMATGRWVVQHHRVFSTEIFSYTAEGRPWIYPVGAGVLFYGAFLAGGYALISWVGSVACAGTIALLLRRGSAVTAALAIIAVPAIAARTAPRADLFTVVLFAAFLSILWEQSEAGTGKLWLLPLLMVAWVNLHLGFVAGLTLVCAYVALEAIRFCDGRQKKNAANRLKAAVPWVAATFFATLVNPWGWGIYQALFRQEAAMGVHSGRITEWAGVSFTRSTLGQALAIQDPASAAEWILFLAAVAAVMAALRSQWPAAVLLVGTLWIAMRHVRFFALLACVVVIVGGAVLTSALKTVQLRIRDKRLLAILGAGAAAIFILLASIRSFDLVSNHNYFNEDGIESFGAGLSWWFPERAMAFIERENLPAQIFNGYETGGFLVWRLGPKYGDYVDGRAIPFGPELFSHLQELLQSRPDSPQWQREADSYRINTVLFSVARHDGLKFVGSVLPYYCSSKDWRPVYLDEVSAVFVRRQSETQPLIDRFPLECSTAPLPTAAAASDNRGAEFNRWANAAALLLALQRSQEAETASTQALYAYDQSAALWYIRGKARLLNGHPREAEADFLQSAALKSNVATWSELADLYRSQKNYPAAIDAMERLASITPNPAAVLVAVGYTYLETHQPQKALDTFDRAEKALPAGAGHTSVEELNNGRALARNMLSGRREP
jgi:tetratricopeptide (TPR) repeat protein